MRPRPDAAENAGALFAGGEVPARASMRPRPDAAENGTAATWVAAVAALQ